MVCSLRDRIQTQISIGNIFNVDDLIAYHRPAVDNILSRNHAKQYLSPRETLFVIPEPTARSAVPGVSPGQGLLIPHGYLHPGKSKHSEVQSPSMIAGASLWFVVQDAWVVISLIS